MKNCQNKLQKTKHSGACNIAFACSISSIRRAKSLVYRLWTMLRWRPVSPDASCSSNFQAAKLFTITCQGKIMHKIVHTDLAVPSETVLAATLGKEGELPSWSIRSPLQSGSPDSSADGCTQRHIKQCLFSNSIQRISSIRTVPCRTHHNLSFRLRSYPAMPWSERGTRAWRCR